MQRIARLSNPESNPALDGYAELQRVLRQYLPPSTVNLYARPKRVDAGMVEWYSELGGQPVPLRQLDEPQAEAARSILTERLAGVRQAAEQLAGGDKGAATRKLLLTAAQPPADKNVYVLDGQPVITAWGGGKPVTAAAASVAGAVAQAAPKRRVWLWLLLALLTLLAAGILWWLLCEPETPPTPPAPPVEEPALEPEPEPEPELMCPGERPAESTPEMVIVFDSSNSMQTSLSVDVNELPKAGTSAYDDWVQVWLGRRAPTPTQERWLREPKRITIARQATVAMVEQLAPDVKTGLVVFSECTVNNLGFYSQRSALIERIGAIEAKEGTPLAASIRSAADMVDGINRDAIILVISDGDETCDGDPCAVAQALARSKPRLKINVVDINGAGAGNCLAGATGGRVFTAHTVQEMQTMMHEAAQEVLVPAQCRPPLIEQPVSEPVKDAKFFEAKWIADTRDVDEPSNWPGVAEITFGKGRVSTVFRSTDGVTCRGSITATVENGRLHIPGHKMTCSNGSSSRRWEVRCEPDGNDVLHCQGISDTNKIPFSYDIRREQ